MARIKPLMEVLKGVTRFGRLTVQCEAERLVSPSGFAALAAHVICDCGTVKVVQASALKSGASKSCGCLQRELAAANAPTYSTRHGHGRRGKWTTEYSIWRTMKARCNNPKATSYADYGGRGISVCDRWASSFPDFLADMGLRPPGTTLDRVENSGNYEPSNCRWATGVEQATNRRPMRARKNKDHQPHA